MNFGKNLKIELFIQHGATTIFYYNINKPEQPTETDVQLISGLLNATSLFFENLGYASESSLFRIIRGGTELRMLQGNQCHGTMILRDFEELDKEAYRQLDELLRSVILQFEEQYIPEIEIFISQGVMQFEKVDEFIKNQIQKMKAHMYSSYLIKILGEAINVNVKRKLAMAHLISINKLFQTDLDWFTIYSELDAIRTKVQSYQKKHVSIKRIIKKVNSENKQVWDLFSINLIPQL